MKDFKEMYSKEFVFTSSSPNKKKKHWIQNDLIFSICEQFLIPLKEAEMKLSISDFWKHWYGLVEYAKKILSLVRVSYLVNGVKSLRHQQLKIRATYY